MEEQVTENHRVEDSSASSATSGNGTSSFEVDAKCMASKRFACLYRPNAMKTT